MLEERVITGRGGPAVGVPGWEPDAMAGRTYCGVEGWGGVVVELERPRDCVRRADMEADGDIVPRYIPGSVATPDTAAGRTAIPVGVPCGVPVRDRVPVGVPPLVLEGVPCLERVPVGVPPRDVCDGVSVLGVPPREACVGVSVLGVRAMLGVPPRDTCDGVSMLEVRVMLAGEACCGVSSHPPVSTSPPLL